jgi:hypothetical protein
MPVSYTRRKLRALQAKRREQFGEINRVIRRRLSQFLTGKLSSEEFEKETREERNVAKLQEKILRIEDPKPRFRIWKVRTEKR